MELQNFNSIFELYVTFTVAYVVVDEIIENPFVSVVAQKFLKKYDAVSEVFFEIHSAISGNQTSLRNLLSTDSLTEEDRKGIDNHLSSLHAISKRVEQSQSEIQIQIRSHHRTEMFGFLNFYLFLYSFTVLFISGLYDDPKVNADYNSRIDNALAVVVFFTVLIIIVSWCREKKVEGESPKMNSKKAFFVPLVSWVVVVVSACLLYYFKVAPFDFTSPVYVSALYISAVFIPVSNFIFYFIKTSRRSSKSLGTLLQRANIYKDDYMQEIQGSADFVGHIRTITKPQISTSDNQRK